MKVLVVSSAVAVVCCAHSLMAATYYKVGTDAGRRLSRHNNERLSVCAAAVNLIYYLR